MYVRAKIELIADKDAGTFSADSGEWVLQYPLPSGFTRVIARWLLARTDAAEGPEPAPSYVFPGCSCISARGSHSMATGIVDPKANKP